MPERERDEIHQPGAAFAGRYDFGETPAAIKTAEGLAGCGPVPRYLRRARLRWRDPSPGPGRLNHSPEGRAPSVGRNFKSRRRLGGSRSEKPASVKVAARGRCRILTRICISLCESGSTVAARKKRPQAKTCGRGCLPSTVPAVRGFLGQGCPRKRSHYCEQDGEPA